MSRARAPAPQLTPDSAPAEVVAWLRHFGFADDLVDQLSRYFGDDMFDLCVCAWEGGVRVCV